jgi:PAS domain S-box-containing protein
MTSRKSLDNFAFNSMDENMSDQDQVNFKLRSDAEEKLALLPSLASDAHSLQGLLHEVEVHRIELEMQNQQLREALEELTASRNQFADLYEFAPCAYLTLRADGSLSKINGAGASLLGEDRAQLIGRHFALLIAGPDRNRWQQHFAQSMQVGGKKGIGVALALDAGTIDVAVSSLTQVAHTGVKEMLVILTAPA